MAKKAKKKERDALVVASKIREYVKSNDCNTSGEFIGELSSTVYDLIDKAINRAQGNNRKIRGADRRDVPERLGEYLM